MRRIRFNIASLLGVILVLGIGLAALREASDLWDSGVFTVTLAALVISILLAMAAGKLLRKAEAPGRLSLGFQTIGHGRHGRRESRIVPVGRPVMSTRLHETTARR